MESMHRTPARLTTPFLLFSLLLVSCGEEDPDVVEEPASAESLEEFLEEHSDVLAEEAVVAVIQDGETHTASTGGADTGTVFELASLSKPLTGMLLADAWSVGRRTWRTRSQSTCRSWRAPRREASPWKSWRPIPPGCRWSPAQTASPSRTTGTGGRENPYEVSTEELIGLAEEQTLDEPGRYVYSNFGIALLGHALAETAGMTYEELLQERLTGPLGMEDTTTSDTEGHPSDEDLLQGYDSSGEVEDFGSEAFSPASSSRSTVHDYLLLIEGIFDGTAPGAEAIEQSDINPDMGLGWHLEPEGYVWHNGISNGYATIVAMDPETQTAAVIFSNYGRENTVLGMDLLEDLLSS